jgi:hypothetical protein
MASSTSSSLATRWSQWIARIQTGFHLWCAEHELRAADPCHLSPSLRQARMRTLDALRQYRDRGEFPVNSHDPAGLAPCFMDSAGRQCAVAYLMHQSEAAAVANEIARTANLARIRNMHLPELDAWARRTGLSKPELARVQPGYPPTVEQADRYGEIILSVWFLGALAVNSMIFNLGRLIWAYRPRLTTMLAGVVLGIGVLFAGIRIDPGAFGHTHGMHGMDEMKLLAVGIGFLSIVCGVIPFFSRRGKWQPTGIRNELALFSDRPASPPSEQVSAGEPPHSRPSGKLLSDPTPGARDETL